MNRLSTLLTINVVREIVDGALWRLLLRRVAAGTVILRQVRDDALGVALCAERPRLEQRFPIEDALRVDVEACLHIVEGILSS